jgi:hypothetical protein
MPSPLRDTKSLPEWIELDYYRRPRRLRRAFGVAVWVTLLVTPLLLAWTLWPRQQVVYEAAPVSPAHTLFNKDCGVCHKDMFQTARRLVPTNAAAHSVPDSACVQCHDGPPHHADKVAGPPCASCHQEHRGKAALADVGDRHCTACHANLAAAIHQESAAYANVATFASHPDFRLLQGGATDHTALHFNHKVHLRAEGVRGPDGTPKTLTCADCHRTDAEGHYMVPVTYEQSCKTCHPLSVQLAGKPPAGPAQEAAELFRREPAPHRTPAEVRAQLLGRLESLQERHPQVTAVRPDTVPRPFPWQKPLDAEGGQHDDWAEAQLRAVERVLFDGAGGCRYCHIPADRPAAVRPGRLPEYLPTQMPTVWFTSARFDHRSHRMLGCAECHPAAESSRTTDVLLPHIDTCKRCHGTQAGLRSDCVECHRYHNRNEERAGPGLRIDEALNPAGPRGKKP